MKIYEAVEVGDVRFWRRATLLHPYSSKTQSPDWDDLSETPFVTEPGRRLRLSGWLGNAGNSHFEARGLVRVIGVTPITRMSLVDGLDETVAYHVTVESITGEELEAELASMGLEASCEGGLREVLLRAGE